MPTIYLVEGPVGAGKSTYAAKLSAQRCAPHLDLDQWMVTLFSPDRPSQDFYAWYQTCKERCVQQIWQITEHLLSLDLDVVLELGLVQQELRQQFYARVDAVDAELKVYVLDVDEDLRRERVRARNAAAQGTYKMTVSDEVFELANAAWQAPDAQESAARHIEWVFDEDAAAENGVT